MEERIKNLPLSWQFSSKYSNLNEQKLVTTHQIWLRTGRVDFDNFDKLINSLKAKSGFSFILRGCSQSLTDYLSHKHFDHIIFAKEAVLSFSQNHFNKKSLQQLIKRGSKKGMAVEVERSNETIHLLEKLKRNSRHGKEPQLKNLFLTEFSDDTRLFVFIEPDKEWLGAILISVNSPEKFHTELLLKHNRAPAGIMETLIFSAFEALKNSGKKEMSLGEVPFYVHIPITKSFYRDYILNRIAKFFRFAYNYKGLYDFKNKFNPRWNDVYICGYPKLRLSHIAGVIIKSNLLALIFYKIKKRIFD